MHNGTRGEWPNWVLQEIPEKVVADTTDTTLTPLMDSSAARSPRTKSAGGFVANHSRNFPKNPPQCPGAPQLAIATSDFNPR